MVFKQFAGKIVMQKRTAKTSSWKGMSMSREGDRAGSRYEAFDRVSIGEKSSIHTMRTESLM